MYLKNIQKKNGKIFFKSVPFVVSWQCILLLLICAHELGDSIIPTPGSSEEKPAGLIVTEWLSTVIKSLLTPEKGTQKASGVKGTLQKVGEWCKFSGEGSGHEPVQEPLPHINSAHLWIHLMALPKSGAHSVLLFCFEFSLKLLRPKERTIYQDSIHPGIAFNEWMGVTAWLTFQLPSPMMDSSFLQKPLSRLSLYCS